MVRGLQSDLMSKIPFTCSCRTSWSQATPFFCSLSSVLNWLMFCEQWVWHCDTFCRRSPLCHASQERASEKTDNSLRRCQTGEARHTVPERLSCIRLGYLSLKSDSYGFNYEMGGASLKKWLTLYLPDTMCYRLHGFGACTAVGIRL